jgi:SAM-dependent methyltransferase
MTFMFWKKKESNQGTVKADLFGDDQCYVTGPLSESGFGEIYLPDRLRGIGSGARCRCRIRSRRAVDPYLLIRAIPSGGGEPRELSVMLNGSELGTRPIPRYGTYYFAIPSDVIRRGERDWADIRLKVLTRSSACVAADDAGIAIYEIKLIDAAIDDFPDRHAFACKLSLFSPAGGKFYEVLSKYPFRQNHRLLEVGAGEGHLAYLTAAFSGASVTGIDVIEYDRENTPSTSQQLADEFRLHRALLRKTSGLGQLGNDVGLSEVMRRTSHITMDAEQMELADESFDFVYSLNVMEHIPHPGRAFKEIGRVLRPGGLVILQFSPLYYSDSGSHLPSVLGFNRPWAQLLMTRDQIKQAIVESGGVPNEVDNILDSLNGCPVQSYYDAVEGSGLEVVFHEAVRGFTLPGAGESAEYQQLLNTYSEVDLTTYGMCWLLRKPS